MNLISTTLYSLSKTSPKTRGITDFDEYTPYPALSQTKTIYETFKKRGITLKPFGWASNDVMHIYMP